jgi:hypothetical protein
LKYAAFSEFLTRMEYDQFVQIAEGVDEVGLVHCSGSVVMTDLMRNLSL